MDKNYKEWKDQYNPFNSLKVLAWREELEAMARGECPVPVNVTIDPTNKCNLNCVWCIMQKVREGQESIPDDVLLQLPEFIWSWGCRSVCVGGGGEPLCHPKIAELLVSLHNYGLSVGTITNGVSMSDAAIEAVVHSCQWIGFSIDAARQETWDKIKRHSGEDGFKNVLKNVYWIAKHKRENRPRIGMKFLFHHLNYLEIYEFAKLAKEVGADDAHFRPAYIPNYHFTEMLIGQVTALINEARKDFEDGRFRIFGITHKFTEKWERAIRFKKCLATPINAYFLANGTLALCCDRRDDPELNLGPYYPFKNVLDKWGSDKHKEMIAGIDPLKCPRCTQCITQEIIQNVIIEDSMCLESV